jgi:serine/threonine-protein kinase
VPAVKLLDVSAGQRLERYELVGELASGGMATVYLGRLVGVGGFQRFVAIKRLHPHLASEDDFVEMFLDEARLAASIHHPNVVPILEVGTSERGYFLVMEYVEGDTLARLLARAFTMGQRIPVPILVRILLDTLAGLHAAHELKDENNDVLGVVHRDVSPQNILVGIDGAARITDFGVARAATRLSSTRAGQLKGKLAYMAPEQAKGVEIDRRADLFSIGTVLWEVLASKRLFKGEGEAETLNRVLFEPIPRLRNVAPDVPSALEIVTMRALERDAQKRYATAAEMADALERAARTTVGIAAGRDVAQYVQVILGDEIANQREAVRGWLLATENRRSQTGDFVAVSAVTRGVSSVSSSAISIPPPADPTVVHQMDKTIATGDPRALRRWGAYGVVMLLGLLGGGFFVWPRSARTIAPTVVAPADSRQAGASAAKPTAAVSSVGFDAPAASAPTMPAAAVTPPAVAAAPASRPAAPPAPAPRGGNGRVRPRPTIPQVAHPTGPAAPADDIPLNPYR